MKVTTRTRTIFKQPNLTTEEELHLERAKLISSLDHHDHYVKKLQKKARRVHGEASQAEINRLKLEIQNTRHDHPDLAVRARRLVYLVEGFVASKDLTRALNERAAASLALRNHNALMRRKGLIK